MPVPYSKWPQNIQIFTSSSPSKIYPNFDFWFENKPSGNPALIREEKNEVFNRFVRSVDLINQRLDYPPGTDAIKASRKLHQGCLMVFPNQKSKF
jgi:hypothetical protein